MHQEQIRPFFLFYGGKWRDTPKHYPEPIYDTIIEPFAGSAGYSLRYPDRKVKLYDIDPIICGIWDFLIKAKSADILAIPDLLEGESIEDLKVCDEARNLVGFWLNKGTTSPRKSPSAWMRSGIRPGSFWGDRVRNTIATQLEYIRHWKIYNRTYLNSYGFNKATWFIDPPYKIAGSHYKFGSKLIDYDQLSKFCLDRKGQVIVCENKGANWLPFKDLAEVKTTRQNRSSEVIWMNE